MKLNTLEKLHACMAARAPELMLPPALVQAARRPLERMLEMSANIAKM